MRQRSSRLPQHRKRKKMAHYIISYDLHKDRNYEPVWALLQSWGCVRLLESVWLGSLTGGAGAIRKAVSDAMDADDSVAVIELKPGSEWAAPSRTSCRWAATSR